MKKLFYAGSLPAGLLLLALSFIMYSINSYWDWINLSMLGLGAALTILYISMHIRQTIALLGRRDAKYGTNALVTIIAVLGIIILVNFIVSKRNYRMDLTAGNLFSLSEQTVKILKNLDKNVEIYAFFKSIEDRQMRNLMIEYAYHSPKFSFEFIDPDKSPELPKKYNVTAYNTTVLICGEKQEKITTQTEEDMTNALVKVTREGRKTIYFSEGHGEKSTDDSDREGYSGVADLIKEQNYEVKKTFIAREATFPEDCSVLVIPGPKNSLFPAELDSIGAYISRGGAVLFMVDPDPSPNMDEFFNEWGVTVGNDMVVDMSGVGRLFGAGPGMPLVNTFATHPIVEDFGNTACFFPYVRSVTPKDLSGPGVSSEWLVKTTERSFGETEIQDGKAQYDEDKDLEGPVTVGAVVTKTVERDSGLSNTAGQSSNGKMVVFGDSDFANNMYMRMQSNGNLFMNVVNWLAEEADLVSVRPKSNEDRRLNMTQAQTKMMNWIAMGIPFMVLISGGLVFLRRRKL